MDETDIDYFKPDPTLNTEPATGLSQGSTYVLRVLGDSMVSEGADSFPDGSTITVDPDLQALPGDYVIAVNGVNDTLFRQLVLEGDVLCLKPLNPRHATQPLGGAAIVGVVRELTRRLR